MVRLSDSKWCQILQGGWVVFERLINPIIMLLLMFNSRLGCLFNRLGLVLFISTYGFINSVSS